MLILVAALIVIGIGSIAAFFLAEGDDDESAPVIGAGLPAEWNLCTNPTHRFRIGYPPLWHTTHPEPRLACWFFDPEPFEVEPNTEFPLVALTAFPERERFRVVLDGLTEAQFADTVLREETEIAGRPAVRIETVATGQGLYERGTRTYGYVVDRDGSAFLLTAAGLPTIAEGEWQSRKQIADRAADTLRFY